MSRGVVESICQHPADAPSTAAGSVRPSFLLTSGLKPQVSSLAPACPRFGSIRQVRPTDGLEWSVTQTSRTPLAVICGVTRCVARPRNGRGKKTKTPRTRLGPRLRTSGCTKRFSSRRRCTPQPRTAAAFSSCRSGRVLTRTTTAARLSGYGLSYKSLLLRVVMPFVPSC